MVRQNYSTQAGPILLGPRQSELGIAQFRLKIEGMDGASSLVDEIDSIAIQLLSSASPIRSDKDPVTGTRVVQYSNLSFTLPEGAADPFFELEESFIIKGENSDREEKTGTISYLASDQTELFSLELGGLGLTKVAPAPSVTGKGRPIKPDMYIEDIRFQYSSVGRF